MVMDSRSIAPLQALPFSKKKTFLFSDLRRPDSETELVCAQALVETLEDVEIPEETAALAKVLKNQVEETVHNRYLKATNANCVVLDAQDSNKTTKTQPADSEASLVDQKIHTRFVSADFEAVNNPTKEASASEQEKASEQKEPGEKEEEKPSSKEEEKTSSKGEVPELLPERPPSDRIRKRVSVLQAQSFPQQFPKKQKTSRPRKKSFISQELPISDNPTNQHGAQKYRGSDCREYSEAQQQMPPPPYYWHPSMMRMMVPNMRFRIPRPQFPYPMPPYMMPTYFGNPPDAGDRSGTSSFAEQRLSESRSSGADNPDFQQIYNPHPFAQPDLYADYSGTREGYPRRWLGYPMMARHGFPGNQGYIYPPGMGTPMYCPPRPPNHHREPTFGNHQTPLPATEPPGENPIENPDRTQA